MSQTPYNGAPPNLVTSEGRRWTVHWDRTPEISIIGDFFEERGSAPAAALIHNVSPSSIQMIAEGLSDKLGKKHLKSMIYSGPQYIWCVLAGAMAREHGIMPARLSEEILKYTSNGNAIIYTNSENYRRSSAAIRRFAKREEPITVARAVQLGRSRLSSSAVDDVVADTSWFQKRLDHLKFKHLLEKDIDENPHLGEIISRYIISIDSRHFSLWPESVQSELEVIPNVRIVSGTNRFTKTDYHSSYRKDGTFIILDGPLITPSEAKDFLRPIWMSENKPFIEEIAGNLIESTSFYRRGSSSRSPPIL